MRKKLAEGFGPVYKDGRIAPGFEGLGPTYDTGKLKHVPKTPRTPTPQRTPYNVPTRSVPNLKRSPLIKPVQPRKLPKRYYA